MLNFRLVFAFAMLLLAACTVPAANAPALNSVPAEAHQPKPTAESSFAHPTPDPTVASVIVSVQAAAQPTIKTYPSEDEQHRIDLSIYDCVPMADGESYAYETLTLVGREGEAAILDSQLIACGGLGAYGLDGLFWSPNGRYFYYTPAREGVPDGCGVWQPPIRRLEAQSGVVEDMGGGWVSPDGATIAVWRNQELLFWDADEGELGRVPAADPAQPLTAIRWSPDSQSLVYLQSPSNCDPTASGKSTVAGIGLVDRSQSILLQVEEPVFAGIEWVAPELIRLFDLDSNRWHLDESGLHGPEAP